MPTSWRIYCRRVTVVGRSTFYRYVAQGLVPSIRSGGQLRVPWPELERCLEDGIPPLGSIRAGGSNGKRQRLRLPGYPCRECRRFVHCCRCLCCIDEVNLRRAVRMLRRRFHFSRSSRRTRHENQNFTGLDFGARPRSPAIQPGPPTA